MVQTQIKNNPKLFWNFFSNHNKNSNIPSTLTLNSKSVDSGLSIFNLFAEFFSSVHCPHSKPIINIANSYTH